MLTGFLVTLSITAIVMAFGVGYALLKREVTDWKWLWIGGALLIVHDLVLTNVFGGLPDLFRASHWNWQGKILAVCLTLLIAAHPAFGFNRAGLTLAQKPDGRKLTYGFVFCFCALIVTISIMEMTPKLDLETIGFQLTMPGFEEEPFYRGILLLAFNNAFKGRVRMLGINVGWGGFLTCLAFGLIHGLTAQDNGMSFSVMPMIMTGVLGAIFLWLRERSGSVLLPIFVHNFTNSIDLIV